MADTGIFATTAEVQRHVPLGASSTANTEAYINQYMMEAESLINIQSLYNWSDNFSSLNVDVKGILKMAASCLAAVSVIQYDLQGFQSTNQGLAHINILLNLYDKALQELKDKSKTNRFIIGS